MFTITKTFKNIHLAHRIHTQQLDKEFCADEGKCRCRHLHGHSAEIDVTLSGENLNNHLLIDYNELGFMKILIKDLLDHHTLICFDDPLFDYIIKVPYKQLTGKECVVRLYPQYNIKERPNEQVGFVDIAGLNADFVLLDFFEGITMVNFPTSSELIAKWLFHICQREITKYNIKHKTNIKVLSVGYKESETSHAVYSE